ncbi:MAG: ATP-binding protein [Cyanobacteria bacterium J06559_1]
MAGWYITKAIQARISRRIALWVFCSLLIIEAAILLPSYFKREKDLLASQETLVSTSLESALSVSDGDSSPADENQAIRSALQQLKAQGLLWDYAVMTPAEMGSRVEGSSPLQLSDTDVVALSQQPIYERLAQTYIRSLQISGAGETFWVYLRHDTSQIQQELNGYTVRMLSIILLIALVLTLSTMLGVERLVIHPVLRLREDLLATREDLQAGVRKDAFLEKLPTQKDELGDVIAAFRRLYEQIWQAIEARDRSEQKEKERADQLNDALIQLRQTQSQLLQSEKMAGLGQLVAGIAHEINNPISFIYGNLDPVRDYSQDLLTVVRLYQQTYSNPSEEITETLEALDIEYVQEDLPDLLESMKVGAERIRDIVRSLRTFSRLDETGLKSVDIHEGLESALMLLQHRLKATEDSSPIAVIRDYDELPLVNCYAGLLNQAFINVLTNAIEALESRRVENSQNKIAGRITVRTTVIDEQWVAIEIEDNGPGVSEAAIAKIYDPFFTTKPVGQGTGMGLAICYQIVVDKHQGKLSCRSAPGDGTTFVIQLPIQVHDSSKGRRHSSIK